MDRDLATAAGLRLLCCSGELGLEGVAAGSIPGKENKLRELESFLILCPFPFGQEELLQEHSDWRGLEEGVWGESSDPLSFSESFLFEDFKSFLDRDRLKRFFKLVGILSPFLSINLISWSQKETKEGLDFLNYFIGIRQNKKL